MVTATAWEETEIFDEDEEGITYYGVFVNYAYEVWGPNRQVVARHEELLADPHAILVSDSATPWPTPAITRRASWTITWSAPTSGVGTARPRPWARAPGSGWLTNSTAPAASRCTWPVMPRPGSRARLRWHRSARARHPARSLPRTRQPARIPRSTLAWRDDGLSRSYARDRERPGRITMRTEINHGITVRSP